MRIENISEGKIIGIGEITVLPGETKEIPQAFERSPVLAVYQKMRMAKVTGTPSVVSVTKQEAEETAAMEKKAAEEAEALRQARLAALNSMNEEELGKLANELGIHPADCKDQADVLKKVKAALKKA